MTKGKQLNDEKKAEIQKEFKSLGGGQKNAEALGQKYGVHYTTVYAIVKRGKKQEENSKVIRSIRSKITEASKNGKAKRRTAKKEVKATAPIMYTDEDWEVAFENYLVARSQFAEADKTLKKIAKSLG